MWKTVRPAIAGRRVEDVIFAGASSRPCQKLAEVAFAHRYTQNVWPPLGSNDGDQVIEIIRTDRPVMSGARIRRRARRARTRCSKCFSLNAIDWGPTPALGCDKGRSPNLSMPQNPKSRRRILGRSRANLRVYAAAGTKAELTVEWQPETEPLHEVDDSD